MEGQGLRGRVLECLEKQGFTLAGTCSPAMHPSEVRALGAWLEKDLHRPLAYMSRTASLRADVRGWLPWARGVFCAAMAYNTGRELSAQSIADGRAWVSRYAWGRDYHKVLRARLRPAARILQEAGFRARVCVDSAPLLERALAARAGLGFVGKNGLLIHPRYGSYLFLGEIVTDLPLADAERVPDGCGGCRLCLKGCPTKALVRPRVLDAGRCLSTWTIEHRGPFPHDAPNLSGHLFGCDRCQEVCPYNRKAPLSSEPDFRARERWRAPDPLKVAGMGRAEWEEATRGSAVRRAPHDDLLRNARRVLMERESS